MGSSLEVPSDGGFQALVVIRDDQLHARKPSPPQGPEELLVGGFALGVGYLYAEDLPKAVVPHGRDDEDPLVHHPLFHPHLLVAGIHEQVRVGLRFEPALPPRFELGVKGAGQRRN